VLLISAFRHTLASPGRCDLSIDVRGSLHHSLHGSRTQHAVGSWDVSSLAGRALVHMLSEVQALGMGHGRGLLVGVRMDLLVVEFVRGSLSEGDSLRSDCGVVRVIARDSRSLVSEVDRSHWQAGSLGEVGVSAVGSYG
jgi:hypothetical protein